MKFLQQVTHTWYAPLQRMHMRVPRDADSEYQSIQWDCARTDCTKWITIFFGQQVQIRCCYHILSTIGVLFIL